MHNAAVGAGDEQIIERYLLDAVCGDGKGIGIVAESSAVFTEPCGIGRLEHLAGFAVAYQERKRAVVAQMQGYFAFLIALVDKGEMVLIFDHPVGSVCRCSAAVGVVVIDNYLLTLFLGEIVEFIKHFLGRTVVQRRLNICLGITLGALDY